MSILSKLKSARDVLKAPRIVRRFNNDEEGTTAVEFAIVAGPFFLLIFAIIETSLFFFANQYLETVVDDVARLYRTGQLNQATTQTKFREELCDRIVALFNCGDIITQVEVAAKFSDLADPPRADDPANLDDDGNFTPAQTYTASGPKEILQITASYQWPIYTHYSAPLVSPGLNNYALIQVTAVIQTEPY